MHAAANIVVGIVALIHVYILVLEMFLWERPAGSESIRYGRELRCRDADTRGESGFV